VLQYCSVAIPVRFSFLYFLCNWLFLTILSHYIRSRGPTPEPYAWKIQDRALNMQTEHPVMYEDLTVDSDCMLGQVFLHVWCHERASEGIAGDARDTGNIDKLRVAQYLKGH
jgi:hypothetical protein